MSRVKNQHYVPQCYLRKFGDSNEKINVFDKSKNEIRFNQSINNIASQRFFYDIDFKSMNDEIESKGIEIPRDLKEFTSNTDKQLIENWFSSTVEPLLLKVINNIQATYSLVNSDKLYEINVINDSLRLELLFLLSIQIMRTMEFREAFVNQVPSMMLKMIKKFEGKNDLDFKDLDIEYRKEFKPLLHAQWLLDEEMHMSIMGSLNNHILYIGINSSEIPLYTSDNPVVKCPHKAEEGKSYFGLESEGIEIIYPLTPRLAIVMREREYHNQYSIFENKFKSLTINDVVIYNSLQIEQCYRTVFSLDKEFRLAKEICNYNENIMNIKRTRINVY